MKNLADRPSGRVTGHVRLVERKTGPRWYAKYRLADGTQVQKLLGDAWTGRGRPSAGYYTKRTAEQALQELLADARRGTLANSRSRSGKTFGDACAEWLRFVEHEEQRARSTVRDYGNAATGRLIPRFGEDTPLRGHHDRQHQRVPQRAARRQALEAHRPEAAGAPARHPG